MISHDRSAISEEVFEEYRDTIIRWMDTALEDRSINEFINAATEGLALMIVFAEEMSGDKNKKISKEFHQVFDELTDRIRAGKIHARRRQ